MSHGISSSRRLQDFYRVSSRELKRLDSAQRSPMVALYLECVSNAVTLRSLGAPCLQTYRRKMHELLDRVLQVSMSVQLASQWLSIRLQLLSALVNGVFALVVVLNALYGLLAVSPGLAGLSLIYSTSIVNTLNDLMSKLAETEQEMVRYCAVCIHRLLTPLRCHLISPCRGCMYDQRGAHS